MEVKRKIFYWLDISNFLYIIVLLILAGISISMLTGEKGILNRVKEASEKTEIATDKEQRQLAMYEASMNLSGMTFQGVEIPAGFAPTRIAGESTVDEGLVIIDSEGNEFVWIPVDKKTFDKNFRRTTGYLKKSILQLDEYKTYGEADKTGINERMQLNGISESNSTKQEAIEMYKSVEKNGGFFIGRYETGKNENGKMVCQKNVEVCKEIKWGNSVTDDTGGVVEIARNFDTDNNYSTVNSTLCYSVQWDAALNFIDENYITNSIDNIPKCSENSYVVDSTDKGNYSTEKVKKTGSSIQYKQKNIYDMAGNVWKWTMECTENATMRGARGGSCFRAGDECPSSARVHKNPEVEDKAFGFRIALYLK